MSRQPLFLLACAFTGGIFTEDALDFSLRTHYLYLAVSGFLCLSALLPYYHIYRLRHLPLLFFFGSLGMYAHHLRSVPPTLPHLASKETVIFEIQRKLNSNEKNRRYEIKAWKDTAVFYSVLSLPRAAGALDFRHYYKAEILAHRTVPPYSDFQFDYAKYLSRKGIHYQAYLPGTYGIAVNKEVTLAQKIRQHRLELLGKVDSAGYSAKAREFTKGIILADRTEMDRETVTDFSRSGLVHILAISGSHIAILFWIILAVLSLFLSARQKTLKIILALLLIWSFAIFIDYGSSVLRSCIMITCYYIYVLLQGKTDLLHSMALAALILLAVNSNQLFDVGFQLSFLAVLGIYWLNQPVLDLLPAARNKFQNFMLNVVSVSLAAQIATLPLVLFYFHQYSLVSIPANLIIIPFAELLIIFALLMTVMAGLSLEVPVLNMVYDIFVNSILRVIHFFAQIETGFFQRVPMTILEVLVALALGYCLRPLLRKRELKYGLKLAFVLTLFVSLRFLLDYRASQINEILVHQHYKQKIISVKEADRVRFLLRPTADMEKIQRYIIDPYLVSRRTQNFTVDTVGSEFKALQISGKIYTLE